MTTALTTVRFRHQHLYVAPNHFFFGIAEHARRSWIQAFDAFLVVDGDDPVHHSVDDSAHPIFAIPKLGPNPLALGNVPDHALTAYITPGGIEFSTCSLGKPGLPAIKT